MIILPWSFNGPISNDTLIAFALILIAGAIILPSPKSIHTWKIYGWLFCLAGVVASSLLFGSFIEALRILIKRWASMTRKAAGIIHRIIYREPEDWEDEEEYHEYGI